MNKNGYDDLFIIKNLEENDIDLIKYHFSNEIGYHVCKNITTTKQLLETLKKNDIIEDNNYDALVTVLNLIGRKDLAKKLGMRNTATPASIQESSSNLNQSYGLPKDSNVSLDCNKRDDDKQTYKFENIKLDENSDQNNFMKAPESTQCQAIENTQFAFIQDEEKEDENYHYVLNGDSVCHIINNSFAYDENIERKGTECDATKLKKVFESLKFNVNVHNDQDAQNILKIIKETPKSQQNIDCFVCCILSHGFEDGVYGNDNKELLFSEMIAAINGSSAPSLIGKPKIFFVQACQGNLIEKGVTFNKINFDNQIKKTTVKSIPANADFCLSVASFPGFVASREDTGTWYIQTLCEVLQKHAVNKSLTDMLIIVNSKVASEVGYTDYLELVKQMPSMRHVSLTKNLFFKTNEKFNKAASITDYKFVNKI